MGGPPGAPMGGSGGCKFREVSKGFLGMLDDVSIEFQRQNLEFEPSIALFFAD